MPKNTVEHALCVICKRTSVSWAVCLEWKEDWEIVGVFQFGLRRQAKLLGCLKHDRSFATWVEDTAAIRKNRGKKNQNYADFPVAMLYAFPCNAIPRIFLVGGRRLKASEKDLFQIFANSESAQTNGKIKPEIAQSLRQSGISSFSPNILEKALTLVVDAADHASGWLAIRSGDTMDIKACTRDLPRVAQPLLVDLNPVLLELVESGSPKLITSGTKEWGSIPRHGYKETAVFWAGLPMVIGKRVIGLIGLWCERELKENQWARICQVVEEITPAIEGSLAFADLSNHLHRLALLNDFSIMISTVNKEELIVQRLFALLKRAFETDQIILLVNSQDGSHLQQYILSDDAIKNKWIITESAAEDRISIPSNAIRIGNILENQEYFPYYPNSSSAMLMPLKYHTQVIGGLILESNKSDAFTTHDEHLIAVIASQLAGFLENTRLKQDAEARARNLSLIHDLIQQVIRYSDVDQLAQAAAEIMARNFGYDLAAIALLDDRSTLRVAGIGGKESGNVGKKLMELEDGYNRGDAGRVASSGQSLLINNVSPGVTSVSSINSNTHSVMCVAMKSGAVTLGVIEVKNLKNDSFGSSDLLVLESLAGFLASVISNVSQYQKLMTTVNQLQTARHELQERINSQRMAESKLVQAAKLAAVGEMAAGIAHELNNPLTTISGFTELVLENLSDSESARSDLEFVLREAQRARNVVRRLLDFARQSESVRSRCNLNEIIIDVMTMVNHLFHMNGIQIETAFREDIPWIMLDRNQFKQVIVNLLNNALHAMPTGGILILSTEAVKRDERNGVLFSVQDNGIGIPPDHLEHVFDPFFTTRSQEGGTGLGLSVSYGIVVDHGGEIWAESQVGTGSTFRLWLPCEE